MQLTSNNKLIEELSFMKIPEYNEFDEKAIDNSRQILLEKEGNYYTIKGTTHTGKLLAERGWFSIKVALEYQNKKYIMKKRFSKIMLQSDGKNVAELSSDLINFAFFTTEEIKMNDRKFKRTLENRYSLIEGNTIVLSFKNMSKTIHDARFPNRMEFFYNSKKLSETEAVILTSLIIGYLTTAPYKAPILGGP